ncbi:MAG: hypothetical protein D6802_05095 [Ardenticatenia bacterium]|nr:MAG: hypothetical protein D6802_05095 [Ardenticatenia bacterium]
MSELSDHKKIVGAMLPTVQPSSTKRRELVFAQKRVHARTVVQAVGGFLLFVVGLAWLQFSTPNLVGNDGYYHIKMAYLLRTEGLRPAFIWLPLTVLNSNQFVDHHYLFHVLLMPFTFGDLRLGAKWGSVFMAALAGVALWWILRRRRVPWATLWALGFFVVSDAFLYRMSMPRAQSLSLFFLLVAVAWLLDGHYRRLALLGFLYVWAYNAFPLLIVLTGAYGVATLLAEGRFEWRPLAYSLLGIAAGLVVNPYFPQNVLFLVHHIAPKLGTPTEIAVGNEWYPYKTDQLVRNMAPAMVLLALGWLAQVAFGVRQRTESLFFTLCVLLFGMMVLQSRRFVEYAPPFVLLFAAYHLGPWLGKTASRRSNVLSVALLLAGFVTGGFYTLPRAQAAVQRSAPSERYQAAATWLAENTPPGSRVFQTDWDDFPRLFFYNHHNTYLVGLDPVFLERANPGLYTIWVDITEGRNKTPGLTIHTFFGAEYVFTDHRHAAFLRVAADDPYLKEVYRDDFAVIFAVTFP